jgi:hypothetical protein
MVIYHIVVVMGVDISMKRRGVVDYMYLAILTSSGTSISSTDIILPYSQVQAPQFQVQISYFSGDKLSLIQNKLCLQIRSQILFK